MDAPVPAFLYLFCEGALDRLGLVAQHVRAKAGGEIDVDVAVDVGEASAVRALDVDGVWHHHRLDDLHGQ